jgi:hypothetical protein
MNYECLIKGEVPGIGSEVLAANSHSPKNPQKKPYLIQRQDRDILLFRQIKLENQMLKVQPD